jgi:hypothetical protein
MSDTTNELERAVGQLRDIRAVMAQHGRSVATLSWTLLDALLSGIAEQSRRIAELEAARSPCSPTPAVNTIVEGDRHA